jgi:hypothetical protein
MLPSCLSITFAFYDVFPDCISRTRSQTLNDSIKNLFRQIIKESLTSLRDLHSGLRNKNWAEYKLSVGNPFLFSFCFDFVAIVCFKSAVGSEMVEKFRLIVLLCLVVSVRSE